jgi:LemA protein
VSTSSWIAIACAVCAGVPALAYAVSYNRLISERQEVDEAWAVIGTELQRRHGLVPTLIETVRATAAHEHDVLVELARHNDAAAAASHTPSDATKWEPPLARAVAQVLALRERYPALDSQQNFLRVQHELSITEDRIAAARRFYNTRVAQLNTRVEAFPSAVVARRHGVGPADYYDPD